MKLFMFVGIVKTYNLCLCSAPRADGEARDHDSNYWTLVLGGVNLNNRNIIIKH